MPGYQDHLLIGSLLSAVLITVLSSVLTFTPGFIVLTTFVIMIGSVFPDVDHREAKIHRLLRAFLVVVSGMGAAFLAYPALPWMAVAGLLTGSGVWLLFEAIKPRHRDITHTLRAGLVFGTLIGAISLLGFGSVMPGVFGFVAYLSHLLLDGTLRF